MSNIEEKRQINKAKLLKILIPIICGVVFLLLWGFDIMTKHIAYNLGDGVKGAVLHGNGVIFDFVLTFNTGMAFSLLNDQRILLTIISFVMSAAIIVFFILRYKKNTITMKILCAIILAGAVGNLVDRFFSIFEYGIYAKGVVDFIEFAFWRNFATFNLADSYLVCGLFAVCIYMVLDSFIFSKKKGAEQVQESQGETNKLLFKEEIERMQQDSLKEKDNKKDK